MVYRFVLVWVMKDNVKMSPSFLNITKRAKLLKYVSFQRSRFCLFHGNVYILQINGQVLYGRSHQNATAIINNVSAKVRILLTRWDMFTWMQTNTSYLPWILIYSSYTVGSLCILMWCPKVWDHNKYIIFKVKEEILQYF